MARTRAVSSAKGTDMFTHLHSRGFVDILI